MQVNSTPMQTSVASNGTYRLEIEPGVYLLSAISRDNATSSQVLDVRRDGNYRLDMVLFEELDVSINESFIDLDGNGLPDLGEEIDPQAGGLQWPLAVLAAVIAVALAYYFLAFKKHRKPAVEHAAKPDAAVTSELAEEKEVMAVLDESDGLITQKDLRKALPHWSEARVSLVVTSLEASGKLKKIKKGRGNIIRKA